MVAKNGVAANVVIANVFADYHTLVCNNVVLPMPMIIREKLNRNSRVNSSMTPCTNAAILM